MLTKTGRKAVRAEVVVRQLRALVAEALAQNLRLDSDEVRDGEDGVAEGGVGGRIGGVEAGHHVQIVVLVRGEQAVNGVAQRNN